jgi:P pilus assembly chaperone PapD
LQVIGSRHLRFIGAALITALSPAVAQAELVLSELIVELQPGKQAREDLEIWNNSPERAYVAIAPREIVNPSLPSQSERREADPEKLGILVSPSRMILEPGARKLVRLATLLPSADRERVYRVTVKPVIGGVDAKDTGLKILVGYDVLVLVRPGQPIANVTAVRDGRKLKFNNNGNVSVELMSGKQCDSAHVHCTDLPAKRLYPGASWIVELGADGPAEYMLRSPGRADRRIF